MKATIPLALALWAGGATATAISGATFQNLGTAPQAISEATHIAEYGIQGRFIDGPSLSGDTARFTHHTEWMLARRNLAAQPPETSFEAIFRYELQFTVEDPLLRGYSLNVATLLRGQATAAIEVTTGAPKTSLSAANRRFGAAIDDGSGLVDVPALFGDEVQAEANSIDGASRADVLVEDADAEFIGHYVGSRTFTLVFGSEPENHRAFFTQFALGEADLRFGGEPTLSGFANAGSDGNPYGHYVSVFATFDPVVAVPEPGGAALAGLALLVAGGVRTRSSRTRA